MAGLHHSRALGTSAAENHHHHHQGSASPLGHLIRALEHLGPRGNGRIANSTHPLVLYDLCRKTVRDLQVCTVLSVLLVASLFIIVLVPLDPV